YTIMGSLPWTAAILYAGMVLGESWTDLMEYGHEASMIFVVVAVIVIAVLYLRWRRKKNRK
ncbi:MAG: DedA family protein, partial [Selenomonas sp.]|nr:DedA family protein [Selenomonas sp.]